jgi:hypothetical protein
MKPRHGMKHDAQEIYARWLEAGSKLAFAFALATLLLYLAGALPPLVPLAELPRLWTLSAAEMMREAHAPGGWSWLHYLRYGDYLNVLGISLFALLALICTARVVPAFWRSGERMQALLALLQVLVLLAAALHLFPGAH